MVLTHMTLKYNKLSDIAAGPFFQVSGFQVSRILPMILQQEPNLSIIVASFMDQINEIRKKVGFIEINILNYITFLFFISFRRHPITKNGHSSLFATAR